jgi:phosphatidylserine decarboxylase
MKIHKEGYGIILIAILLFSGVYFLAEYFLGAESWIFKLILLTCIVLFVLVVQFFRNPFRTTPTNEGLVVCPADGKVVVIEETDETEYLKDRRIQLSIFMSPLNVHVNRSPVTGRVDFVKYHPGKYLVAWHPKASTENERTTIVVETPKNEKVLFRQIAGAVARRIRWYVKEGQPIAQGQEFGFIKFGSRVDVFLPLGTEIKVQLNQKVKGGETILAQLK